MSHDERRDDIVAASIGWKEVEDERRVRYGTQEGGTNQKRGEVVPSDG